MAPIRLTDSAIGAALRDAKVDGARRELADPVLPGLRLRVMPSGTRTWSLACRDGEGRMRRFPLGPYPDTGIAAARDAARALRQRVRQDGADPIEDARRRRKAARDAADGIGSLGALVAAYGRQHGPRLRNWRECDRRIRSVFAGLIARPMGTVRRADLQLAADDWPAAGSASAAVRYLKPVLRWAGERELCGMDLTLLRQPQPVKRKDRVLSRAELAALLPALATSDSVYAAALSLILLTAARREEAGAARWGDVDLAAGTWRIPETKSGRPHVVPLARQAVALFRAQQPDGQAEPAPDALVFRARGGGRLANWDKATKLLQAASGTDGWTRHDLRRTAATLMGEMGEPPHVIEAALNHAAIHSQLAATYNRSRYQPEVRAALQRLADALDGIAGGGAQVIPLGINRAS